MLCAAGSTFGGNGKLGPFQCWDAADCCLGDLQAQHPLLPKQHWSCCFSRFCAVTGSLITDLTSSLVGQLLQMRNLWLLGYSSRWRKRCRGSWTCPVKQSLRGIWCHHCQTRYHCREPCDCCVKVSKKSKKKAGVVTGCSDTHRHLRFMPGRAPPTTYHNIITLKFTIFN